MTKHSERNWHSRWTLSDDEQTAKHETGLVAHFDGVYVTIDDASRDAEFAALAAEKTTAIHAGATVARLMQRAEQLFKENFLPSVRDGNKLRLRAAQNSGTVVAGQSCAPSPSYAKR